MLTHALSVVPFVVAVLISLIGYRMSTPRGRALIDSPWFWVFAFSTVGLLGVWAVSHKYDDRQKRLEARYEAQQRLAQPRSQDNTTNATGQSSSDPGTEGENVLSNQTGYSTKRKVPLQFLALGLAIVSGVSAAILWRASRDA